MDTTVDRLVLSLLSHPRYLCVLQGFLGSLLVGLGFRSHEAMRVTLAVHEACANVVKHGYQGGYGTWCDRYRPVLAYLAQLESEIASSKDMEPMR